jgi:hypothetical protein
MIMQAMQRNTQAAAHGGAGIGGAGAAPARAATKRSVSYDKFRPAMASALMREATASLNKAAKSQLLAAARLLFMKEATEDISALDLHYLANDVLRRLVKDGLLGNLPAPGAPKKLSDADAERACELLINGNGKEGEEWIGYTSMANAIVECKELRSIQEDSGVAEQTMLRRIKLAHRDKYGRGLKKITVRFKPKLTDEVKAERKKAARRWKKWSLKKLKRTVWIDEKTEYLKPAGYLRCYAPAGATSFARSGNAPLGKAPKLKYEAAVCGFAGPLYFKAITGTTDLALGYRVRTVPSRTDFDPAFGRACAPCCIDHSQLDASIRLCNAQDAVSCGGGLGADLPVPSPLLHLELRLRA